MTTRETIAIWLIIGTLIAGICTHIANAQETTKTCEFATQRLIEIQTDWSHKGFYTGVIKYQSATSTRGTWRENLARYFDKKEDVYKAWNNSPSHKTNLDATSTEQCLLHTNRYWILITWSPYNTIRK